MKAHRSISRRRPKSEKPFKLVVYLSQAENRIVERAAAESGRSKSAFGADVILREARKIVGQTPQS
jgi:uncharacterized protein (DUF1778 family)